MWNVKAKPIPLITGANGNISKTFTQYLGNTAGKLESIPTSESTKSQEKHFLM